MLQIFKKCRIQALALCLLVYVILFIGWITFVPSDSPYLPALFILLAAATGLIYSLRNALYKKAVDKLKATISYFENDCDPQRFIDAATIYVKDVEVPYDHTSFWFLSYYTRGLYESGNLDAAAKLFNELRQNIPNDEKPKERADAIISLTPAIRQLLGGRYALDALHEAENYLRRVGLTISSPNYAYAQWELANLEAQRTGDLRTLAQRMHTASDYEKNSWLVRSECAERESIVYRSWNMPEAEKDRLLFVANHGGQLSCAKRAKKRLAEIEAFLSEQAKAATEEAMQAETQITNTLPAPNQPEPIQAGEQND